MKVILSWKNAQYKELGKNQCLTLVEHNGKKYYVFYKDPNTFADIGTPKLLFDIVKFFFRPYCFLKAIDATFVSRWGPVRDNPTGTGDFAHFWFEPGYGWMWIKKAFQPIDNERDVLFLMAKIWKKSWGYQPK